MSTLGLGGVPPQRHRREALCGRRAARKETLLCGLLVPFSFSATAEQDYVKLGCTHILSCGLIKQGLHPWDQTADLGGCVSSLTSPSIRLKAGRHEPHSRWWRGTRFPPGRPYFWQRWRGRGRDAICMQLVAWVGKVPANCDPRRV